MKDNPIIKWGDSIDWDKRIKRVCKPCWELKYCPYGPLVEQFPLKKERDSQSCIIFGHDCPVFTSNEPLTETKELRDIKRIPSRPTQLKAYRLANGVCQKCKKNIDDEDIHYDHRIPWIKGGSSDFNNIVVLCKKCNLSKGKKFEEEYLVSGVVDHFQSTQEPIKNFDFINAFLRSFMFINTFLKELGKKPTVDDFKKNFDEDDDRFIKVVFDTYEELGVYLQQTDKKNKEILMFRWGFADDSIHSVKEVVLKYNMSEEEMYDIEKKMFKYLGWIIDLSSSEKKKWLKH